MQRIQVVFRLKMVNLVSLKKSIEMCSTNFTNLHSFFYFFAFFHYHDGIKNGFHFTENRRLKKMFFTTVTTYGKSISRRSIHDIFPIKKKNSVPKTKHHSREQKDNSASKTNKLY